MSDGARSLGGRWHCAFASATRDSEESNWSEEIIQSKVSEGSDGSSMPINCHHCLTQWVAMVTSAFDSS